LKAIEEQEVQSRVDKAATLINDSSKTIYTFLGPIATAVTASNSHFETILRCFSDLEIR
jgi:hypothetical protein